MGKIAGVNKASQGGYLHSSKKRARKVERFHDELNGHVFDLERDALRQVVFCPWFTMWWKQATIPYQIVRRPGQQGLCLLPYTRTEVWSMLLVHHQRFVEDTTWRTIGTWNTRTLKAAGKLQKLTHKMDRYRWNILGLCEMRWKNFGEITTDEGHKFFFSRKEDLNTCSMALDFLFTRTSWTLSWDVTQSPAGSSPSTWGQSLSTSQQYKCTPQRRTMMTMK